MRGNVLTHGKQIIRMVNNTHQSPGSNCIDITSTLLNLYPANEKNIQSTQVTLL